MRENRKKCKEFEKDKSRIRQSSLFFFNFLHQNHCCKKKKVLSNAVVICRMHNGS